jgi:YesN/AraC family two-component response regulator
LFSILIAEDEEVFRRVLPLIIDWASLGFRIAGTAENGQAALEFCERERVDVVLTDIRMPVLNGIELAMELRLRSPATKVVLLSAFEDFRYARMGIECGVHGYILKSEGEEEIERYFSKLRPVLDAEAVAAPAIQGCPDDPEEVFEPCGGQPMEGPSLDQRGLKLVREAIAGMQASYQGTVSLESVAARLKVHPAHLSRVFSRDYGKTFTSVLRDIRIEAAKGLLADGRNRIYEVADLVGFEKPRYFSELFKKATGYTPHEYREKFT